MILAADQVERAARTSNAASQYQRHLRGLVDTVAGHWELAEWCRKQTLYAQRELHLRRILELETNHAGARRGLGYSQLRGEWVTREEILDRRGYRRFDGRWMLPQEAALIRADREADAWKGRVLK